MKKQNQYAVAGKELLKFNVGSAVKAFGSGLIGTFSNFTARPSGSGGITFWDSNGKEIHFDFTDSSSAVTAYRKCPPIPAIINRLAKAYINGKVWLTDKDGKEANSKEAEKIKKLLKRPNRLQSWKDFEVQAYIYKKLFGYTIILPIKPYGFPNIEATELWNIPPFMVDIEETNQLFYQKDAQIIKQIALNYKGTKAILQADDVYIMKDICSSIDSVIIPESPIEPLKQVINNIIGGLNSRGTLIDYRGALGVLSPEKDASGTVPMFKTERDELQEDFKRYGLKNNQFQVIISKAAVKWQPMGYATKDLMLLEEHEADVMTICDTFNYPYELLSSNKGVTFSNKNEAKKLLYQDALIPEAENDYDQWNDFFNTAAYNLKIEKDFSHVAILQEDKKSNADARLSLNNAKKIEWDNNLITLNQWLLALDEDPIGPQGDFRISDMPRQNSLLATTIGVGGVQGLIAVVADQYISEPAKQAILEILFSLAPADAARMVVPKPADTSTQNNQDNANN
jgi:phage portal protein BeeE